MQEITIEPSAKSEEAGLWLTTDEEVLDLAQQFYIDAADMCRTGMTLGGYRIPKGDNPDQVIIKYFNQLKRYIEPKRRRVWYSREFQCPPENQYGMRQLAKLIEKGQDINPHQSKRLRKAQLKDALLNDWGVHHFHLGIGLTSDGFVPRTGPLLFARFDPVDVYFLTEGSHDDFSQQELVRILHANCARPGTSRWPRGAADHTAQAHKSRLRVGIEVPKRAIPLSVRRAEAEKRPGLYADGNGLYLAVGKNSKSWIFRYQTAGRRRDMGIGSADRVSLREARDTVLALHKSIRDGIDPLAVKRSGRAATRRMITFREAAQCYIEGHQKPRSTNCYHHPAPSRGVRWHTVANKLSQDSFIFHLIGEQW